MVGTNVTIRMSEDELRRLDDLTQRMNRTRSDVIRDLISRFDETLKGEVEKERKKWIAVGFVGALESIIVDPTLVLRFVRKNVDILSYPDFLIGMVKVKNRVVVFSHHDKIGSQLLSLVRSRVEEEVRREEAELEQGMEEDEDSEGGRPVRPNTIRVAPVPSRYKLLINNKATPPIARPTAANTVGRSIISNGGGSAKSTATASVSKNQKAGSTGIPTSTAPADSQPKDSAPQASAGGGGMDPVRPVGQVSMDRSVGDFAFALVANLYHKRRESLLRFIEALEGDPNAMVD